MAAEVDEGVHREGRNSVAGIDAASAQVPPLERRGEALDLPGDGSARRIRGAGGAAPCAFIPSAAIFRAACAGATFGQLELAHFYLKWEREMAGI
jgi:hypothetical protein